jgi:hypothetical protein
MGYSHNWKQKETVDLAQWREITSAFKKVLEALPPEVKLWGSDIKIVPTGDREVLFYDEVPDHERPPVVSDSAISFDGGCEAMTLLRTPLRGDWPQFCKTEKSPYDIAVVAVLTIANHFAPGAWEIGSDGKAEDWEEGVELASKATGIEMKTPALDKG